MKKTITKLVIAAAVALPWMAGAADIKGNSSFDSLSFTGAAVNFTITWNDLMATRGSSVLDRNAQSDKLWWSLDHREPDEEFRNAIDDRSAASGVEYVSLTGLSDKPHTIYVYGKWEDLKVPGSSRNWERSAGNVSIAAVPEPETYAMLLAGLGLMGAVVRRRNQKQA
jgi:hypothetical protein